MLTVCQCSVELHSKVGRYSMAGISCLSSMFTGGQCICNEPACDRLQLVPGHLPTSASRPSSSTVCSFLNILIIQIYLKAVL